MNSSSQPQPTDSAPSTSSGHHLQPFNKLRTSPATLSPGLIAAIVIYLALAFSYFFMVPMFEAPDEWTHTGHIKYIAEGNGLPVMLPGQGIWGGQQPPLYYAIGAVLVQPFDLSNFDHFLQTRPNPHASIGFALDPGNKNVYLHHSNEAFPYKGMPLAVHVLRLYSIMLGLIALIFAYLTAYELMATITEGAALPPSSFALHHSLAAPPTLFATIVALFVATQPMFTFITASVANEPANIALSAIGVWLAQRYILYGPVPARKQAIALGLTLGLIALSKMTGLSLGLVIAVAILQTTMATRKQSGAARLLWRDCFIIGSLFLLVSGWWYWRNFQLYGDFFQRGLYKLYFNEEPQALTLGNFLGHLANGEISFWATFGWLNIVAPDWVYSLYRIISRIGLLGVIISIVWQIILKIRDWRLGPNQLFSCTLSKNLKSKSLFGSGLSKLGDKEINASANTHHVPRATSHLPRPTSYVPRPTLILIHLVFPITLAFSLTRLVATEGGLQGRQFLPAIGSIAIIIIWGWWVLSPHKWRQPILGGLMTVLLAVAIWLPYTVIAQAYIPPPPRTEAELSANLLQLDYTYNDEIKLIGVELNTDTARPGQRVPITVYWQALKAIDTNYSTFVHLIGRDQQSVGQFNSYPGLGLYPTSTLSPGQIIVDTYPVLINGGSQAPAQLQVNVGLFNFNEPGRPGIPPVAPDGSETSPTVGHLKLIPTDWPKPTSSTPIAEFADSIWLTHTSLDNCDTAPVNCTLTLEWQAQGQPSTDYTVFIQLWHHNEVVGFDRPPLNNNYPTRLWQAGEIIIDPHLINLATLSPAEYQVLIGLYNPLTGDRLPATLNDELLPNYAIDLGTILVRN